MKYIYCALVFFISSYLFSESKPPKVVVVGAGIAGLTTAYRLQQKEIDVEVYEARNRVGGRVLSVMVQDNIAELGAQNITDGGEAENLMRLIEEFGLDLEDVYTPFNHYYFDGQKLIPQIPLLKNEEFMAENLKTRLDELVQKCNNLREVLDNIFEKDDVLYKILAIRAADLEGGPIEKLSPHCAETIHNILHGSLAAAHQTEELHLLSIKGGNSLLPLAMAQALKERVHLNRILKKIVKKDDGYELIFQNNEKVKADILILAIPSTTYSDIQFEEGVIPSEKLEKIKGIQYGTNAKILIPFPDTALKRVVIVNDRASCYFDSTGALLTVYYTDEAGKFSTDTISQVYSEERPMIACAFQNVADSFPMCANDEIFALYENSIGYSWPLDPYAKGSYSYLCAGQELLFNEVLEYEDETVKALFAPIDAALYFAGEHTCYSFELLGTMEAACESGEKAARMVLRKCEKYKN